MVFPQYNYQEFNNSNKKDWPIQPANEESWKKMLIDRAKHYKEMVNIFEFDGLCRPCDLGSDHPYWKLQVIKGLFESIDNCRQQIAEYTRYIEMDGHYKVNAMESRARAIERLTWLLNEVGFNRKTDNTHESKNEKIHHKVEKTKGGKIFHTPIKL